MGSLARGGTCTVAGDAAKLVRGLTQPEEKQADTSS